MRKKAELIGIVAFAVLAIVAAHFYTIFYLPPSYASSKDGKAETRVINVPRGTSFGVVARALEREGVVRDADDFLFAASVLGAQKKMRAGEYEFTTTMKPVEVIRALVSGDVKKYFITVPEGYNINDIASLFEGSGITTAEEFISRATDRALVNELGFKGATLEGYLFPDSYLFTKGMTPDEIIRAMTDRFRSVYFPELDSMPKDKWLTMERVVTLASIIEKETGSADERRLISAVFHNRLKKRIRLQSDPTVIYGIEDFDGNLTRRHLKEDTPYNTYTNYGLPPGPIANPGKESLVAAINPAEGSFLYFVSKNDGTHQFSNTLREHNRAVARFQKNRRAYR